MTPETDEQKLANEMRRAAVSARRLLANADFTRVWEHLKWYFDTNGPSVPASELTKPIDGMSKAMMMARNDGHCDVFDQFTALSQWKPDNDQKEVITEDKETDNEHSTDG